LSKKTIKGLVAWLFIFFGSELLLCHNPVLARPRAGFGSRQAVETKSIVGNWQGIVHYQGEDYLIVFKFGRDAGGRLECRVDSLSQGVIDMPLENLDIRDLLISGDLRILRSRFEGRLQGSSVLDGSLRVGDSALPLILRKDWPEFKKYVMPRIQASGEPQKKYVYAQPASLDDGLAVSSLSSEGIDSEKIAFLGQAILDGQYPGVRSILIVKNGRLVFEEYFYGYSREKLQTLQSATKSVTSILLGLAIDRGAIRSVDKKICDFFPEYIGRPWIDQKYSITLEHALTMTAGLDWNEDLPYTDPHNDNTSMVSSPDWVGYVLGKKLTGTPGEKFYYTSGLSVLLGAVIKKATGLYADEFAQKYLFEPLGISQYRWSTAPDGTRHTGGGLSLKPRDFAKLGCLMANRGLWRGKRVLSEKWVKVSTHPHIQEKTHAYGYQWSIRSFQARGRAEEAFFAVGYGGQFLFVFPRLNAVIVFTAGDFAGDGAKPYERLEKYILPAISLE
jgi:CubicO group peptidase (beta-lactamase class C family)